MITLHDISVGYPSGAVLHHITLDLRPGEVLVLVGPNGCGKSTLLRSVLGLQPLLGGEVRFDGRTGLTPRAVARKAAFLPQSRNVPAITARQLVLHGRFPYLSYPRRYGKADYDAADAALRRLGAADLSHRPLAELSGGQRQKVYLAMALAQGTDTILMDEPTTHLDIRHQAETMAIARELAREGKAVLAVLHDLPLAMHTAHRIGVLWNGRLEALDTPDHIFASGVLDRVFGVTLRRAETETGPQYYCDLSMKGGAP